MTVFSFLTRTVTILILSICTFSGAFAQENPDEKKKELSQNILRLIEAGKCTLEHTNAGGPFVLTASVNGQEHSICSAQMVCEGIETPIFRVDSSEDGKSCLDIKSWSEKIVAGSTDGVDFSYVKHQGNPQSPWESLWDPNTKQYSTTEKCAYATTAKITVPDGDDSTAAFCSSLVGCATKQTDGTWKAEANTAFACPLVKGKQFVDGKEIETDMCPSVSTCEQQQKALGFKVVRAKIRDGKGGAFVADKKKREGSLIPSSTRKLADGRPSLDGTGAAQPSTEGQPQTVHSSSITRNPQSDSFTSIR